jgi:PAS domain S-box-containing protein
LWSNFGEKARASANGLIVKHLKKMAPQSGPKSFPASSPSPVARPNSALANDITERKTAEDRVREQAALLDLASDAILVRDLSGKVRFWNKGAERLYGWSAARAIGNQMNALFPKQDKLALAAAEEELLARGEWTGELRKHTQSGQEVTVSSRWTLLRNERGEPCSVLIIDTDITEKKKLESQFLRAQRIEGIGTLATGMAHDLNNILAPILMSAGYLRWDIPPEEREKAIGRIELSVKRGAEIIQQVLTFWTGHRWRTSGGQTGGPWWRKSPRLLAKLSPRTSAVCLQPARSLAAYGRPHPNPPGPAQFMCQRPRRHAQGRPLELRASI